MTKTPAWRRYLRFWRPNVVADVDDELRFHTEMRVAEYVAGGMTEDDARRAVAERLGDIDTARAECIEQGRLREIHARNANFVDGLRDDIRYALRSLGRSPGWTAVALLTIALGVGATTAVFRVADTLLVRPMPYPHASRVFVFRRLWQAETRQLSGPFTANVVRAFREEARSIEAAASFRAIQQMLSIGDDSLQVDLAIVDPEFFSIAGAHPLIGRGFTPAENAPNGPHVAMLGEDLWRSRYGASSDVIGKVVHLGGESRTIIGVVPRWLKLPDFRSPRSDLWLPYQAGDSDLVQAVAVRLRTGVSREAANQELAAILQRTTMDQPWWRDIHYDVRLLKPQDLLAFGQPLAMLTGAVALLLLVACTNVAHLLLARGATRQRELAVRHALGAGRPRLVRQLVTETLVLAVLGGALALVVAWAGLHVLQAARPESLIAFAFVQTGNGIIWLTAALAIGAGLAVGVASALRSARRDAGLVLRAGAAGTAIGGRRLRGLFVVGEVALSATLLVGALLLVHALYELERKRLGFDAGGLYSVAFHPRQRGVPNDGQLADAIRSRVKLVPGVERWTLAGSGGAMVSSFETPERPPSNAPPVGTSHTSVAPDYFSGMAIPLLAGRLFDDGSLARHEVIINSTLARTIWPNESPLGKRFRNARPVPGPKEWMTVVGVVPDVIENLLAASPPQQIYQPFDPKGPGFLTVFMRVPGEIGQGALARFATSVQPFGPRPEIENVREQIDRSAAEPRFAMRIMVVFAALAVLLAAVGLFGVISYTVGQRTREIGVRMTLGATRGSIARLVVGDGIRLAVIGIVVGLAGATAATRVVQSLLYGVSRFDAFSFGVGAAVLLVVAIVACVVPMWRATGVDPVIAVRAE